MASIRRLRHALKWFLAPLMLRIRAGPLQGCKWSVVSGSRFLGGRHEPYKTAAVAANVRPGDVVYDVGAHLGYYTALAARLAGPEGRVFAFEPRPLNIRLLRRHVRANDLANVRVTEASVGDRTGAVRFESRTGTGTGRVSPTGDLEVAMVRLDTMAATGELPDPDFIKIDVEGGEWAVLQGAREIVRRARPRILVATHDEPMHRKCTDWLEAHGYELQVLEDPAGSGDTEVLALPG